MIPISEPYLVKNSKKYLLNCVETNWISSQGKYILKLEKDLSKYHKVKYCVLTSSCTAALHVSLKAIGIKEGDEVICPGLTFIAPANMIVLSGAKLKLVDVDSETLTICPNKIEKNITNKTKAILVVHQFGHAAHMSEILKIAKKNNLKVIEDNAESIGGKYKGKILGSIGDVSTLSFYANKIITTGEGGAVITNSKVIADKARLLRDHAFTQTKDVIKKYNHDYLGYNYRMTNLQAAIGCAQLESISEILKKRKFVELHYKKKLKTLKNLEIRSYKDWCSPVSWLITLRLKTKQLNLRNKLIYFLQSKGIDARPMIRPVHEAKHFKKFFNKNKYPNSSVQSKTSFHLPSSPNLSLKKIDYVCSQVSLFVKKNEKKF
jgi:perosamine synthetase